MGEIRRLALIYAEDTDEQALIDLDEMQAAMRADRFSEMIDDLTVACRDVLKARGQAPALRSVK
jgi:hypothetical protein